MSLMLTSVRNRTEAAVALAGGSDWIDVKEPRAGALGACPAHSVAAVVAEVAGRAPVSATVGDCWDRPDAVPARVARYAALGVDYVKVGLDVERAAGRGTDPVVDALEQATAASAVILVCMAEKPPGAARIERLAGAGIAGIMLDTANKGGPSLTGLLAQDALRAFAGQARALGLLSGLAGRLAADDVPVLLGCGADYLGFRSALCRGGRRGAEVDAVAVAAVRAAFRRAAATGRRTASEVA